MHIDCGHDVLLPYCMCGGIAEAIDVRIGEKNLFQIQCETCGISGAWAETEDEALQNWSDLMDEITNTVNPE